jgi:DNA polymerase-1
LFESLEEEDDSKVDQIVRIIQYLKTLPVKTVSLPRVEADDIIAYLSDTLPTNQEDRVFIVSSDKDYLQLVSQQVIVYRPIEKEYYTEDTVKEKFGVSPHNFLLYKLLMGDNSDGITGIKGLGPKGLLKRFPELAEKDVSFDDLLELKILSKFIPENWL